MFQFNLALLPSNSAYKPWTEQAGGLEAFLLGAAQNFKVVLKIQDQK